MNIFTNNNEKHRAGYPYYPTLDAQDEVNAKLLRLAPSSQSKLTVQQQYKQQKQL